MFVHNRHANFARQMTYNELTIQELSQVSGGIVPIFNNQEDEKEWLDGYQKYCTKPSKKGRYPEDCFFGPNGLG